jgi:uncharacterized membrane protein YoaT (DUF817 family)
MHFDTVNTYEKYYNCSILGLFIYLFFFYIHFIRHIRFQISIFISIFKFISSI